MMDKEIRGAREDVRNSLRISREQLGPLPLTPEEEVGNPFSYSDLFILTYLDL